MGQWEGGDARVMSGGRLLFQFWILGGLDLRVDEIAVSLMMGILWVE